MPSYHCSTMVEKMESVSTIFFYFRNHWNLVNCSDSVPRYISATIRFSFFRGCGKWLESVSLESHFAKSRAQESLHNESNIRKRHCRLEIVSINPKLENRFVECGMILQSFLHNRDVSESFQDVSRPETSLKSVSDFNCSDRNNFEAETSQSCKLPVVFLHNICTQYIPRNQCRIQRMICT